MPGIWSKNGGKAAKGSSGNALPVPKTSAEAQPRVDPSVPLELTVTLLSLPVREAMIKSSLKSA